MRGWLVVIAATAAATATGCTTGDPTVLRVEPEAIALTVDLVAPAPSQTIQIFAGDRDVTADATLTLTPAGPAPSGQAFGVLDGATFTSNNTTGGAASIDVAFGALATTVPVTVDVRSVRFATGAPADAHAMFDGAARVDAPLALALDPGDGAVLPANLGRLDVDFAAADADTVHEVAITGPHLDVRIYATATPGPRHVEVAPIEYAAIAATSVGGTAELAVASLDPSAPSTARVLRAQVAIAALPASSLWFVGAQPSVPSLWRYDVAAAAMQPIYANTDGTCLGCHLTMAADGRHVIASRSIATPTVTNIPVMIDLETRAIVDLPAATFPWGSGAYDPSGALVASYQGALTVRDGATLAPIATIDPGGFATTPAIAPDGHTLVTTTLDTPAIDTAGPALRANAWNAQAMTLGPPRELARAGAGEAILEPEVSPDSTWVVYSRIPAPATQGSYLHAKISIVPLAGGPSIELVSDGGIPRFVSELPADPTAEPMTWITIASTRDVAGRPQPAGHLWLFAFFPRRGVASRAFHLPGQPVDLSVIHAGARVIR